MNLWSRVQIGLVIFLVAAVMLTGCSSIGVEDAIELNDSRTISVLGYGEASGVPDLATIQLGINLVGDEISELVAEANDAIENIRSALLEQEVAAEDIQTINYNVWAEDRYDPETGKLTGDRFFRVDVTLHVVVRTAKRMAEVLDAALEAGANNIYGISFRIDDTGPLAAEARAMALLEAESRAQQLASGMNVVLGEIINISEGVTPDIAFPVEYGIGGGGTPISPGQSTVTVEVRVSYRIVSE